MDLLSANRELRTSLRTALEQATAIRDRQKATDPMDVVYIGLALEAVNLRVSYLEKRKGGKTPEPE